ncbi:hypothetical protein NE261_01785 [Enterococcus italicus]|uniref:hypothetical protein n=1 Tax=Enterococcus italicus TaxID=246144 RepID=UPI0020744CF5|nr:hypothetical protein [Enterococcus italicus]MCM6930547.1 hypothetical protein [Enterococcus italicus]
MSNVEQVKQQVKAMMKSDKANEKVYKQALSKLNINDEMKELIEMGFISEEEVARGAVQCLKNVYQMNKIKSVVKSLDINLSNKFESRELTTDERQQRQAIDKFVFNDDELF